MIQTLVQPSSLATPRSPETGDLAPMAAPSPMAPAMIRAADAGVLTRILTHGTDLVIWHRCRPPVLDWIDRLDPDAIADLDFVASLDAIAPEVSEGLEEAGYPGGARGAALASEMCTLSRRMGTLFDCPAVRIRLEIVETDACRKLHADNVTARLLMTLRGKGTQWALAASPQDIRQVSIGEVALFKGRKATETPRVLHRSPPMSAGDDARLLLVIDPRYRA